MQRVRRTEDDTEPKPSKRSRDSTYQLRALALQLLAVKVVRGLRHGLRAMEEVVQPIGELK